MYWRQQLKDVALLYSLMDDLQLFWQFKALEWEKLALTVTRTVEEERRTGQQNLSVEKRLCEVFEHNVDYQPLRDRLIMQLQEAIAIADFLSIRKIPYLRTLEFVPPLPDNPPLEGSISEVEELTHYAEKTSYVWHNCLALFRQLWQQFRGNCKTRFGGQIR